MDSPVRECGKRPEVLRMQRTFTFLQCIDYGFLGSPFRMTKVEDPTLGRNGYSNTQSRECLQRENVPSAVGVSNVRH